MIHSFRRSTVVRLFLPLTAVVLLSSAAFAQIAARSGEVSASLGVSTLGGGNTVDGNHHINLGISGGYNITENVAILGEYGYLPLGSTTYSGYGGSLSGRRQTFGPAVRYSFLSSSKIVPYGVFGVGGSTVGCSVSGGTCDVPGGSGGYVSFGGGASFYLGQNNFGIRPEFRFESDSNSGYRTNFSKLTVGGFYQWGGTHSTAAKRKPLTKGTYTPHNVK